MMVIGKGISLVMSWVEGFADSPSIPDSHSPIMSDDRDYHYDDDAWDDDDDVDNDDDGDDDCYVDDDNNDDGDDDDFCYVDCWWWSSLIHIHQSCLMTISLKDLKDHDCDHDTDFYRNRSLCLSQKPWP